LTAVTYFKADVKFVQVQPFRPFSAPSLSRTDRCVCVCIGSWTPVGFFRRTESLIGVEEENEKEWSAYQFSRKAT